MLDAAARGRLLKLARSSMEHGLATALPVSKICALCFGHETTDCC